VRSLIRLTIQVALVFAVAAASFLMLVWALDTSGISDPQVDLDVLHRWRTASTVGQIAQATGAALLDLHGLLPASAFADATGHFDYASDVDGPSLMSERIASKLAAMFRAER